MAGADVILCVTFLEAGQFLESLTPQHCKVYRVACVFPAFHRALSSADPVLEVVVKRINTLTKVK